MSRKKLDAPHTKVTLNLYTESYQRMGEIYSAVGAQTAIRELVKAHVAEYDARRARTVESLAEEIDL